jgi:DNA-directed RNA polymerase specialized sigma24 family protein
MDNTDATDLIQDRESLFRTAHQAAAQGDPVQMLDALFQTGILDGIARFVAANWSEFDFEDGTVFAAAAVDELYSRIHAGFTIKHISGYLFKIALNKAHDEYGKRAENVSLDDIGDLADPRTVPSTPPLPREALKKRALQLARQFLNELGQQNIQRVMAIYFDAVEKGIEDVSTAEIAEALHITEDTVRQCRSRGWRRLQRIAQEHGVSLDQTLAELKITEENHNDDERV